MRPSSSSSEMASARISRSDRSLKYLATAASLVSLVSCAGQWCGDVAVARAGAIAGAIHAHVDAVILAIGAAGRTVADQVLRVQLIGNARRRGIQLVVVVDHFGAPAARVGDFGERF